MEKLRGILNKNRIKLDQKYKELTSNIYFYEELEYYLKPDDRKKKVDYYTARKKEAFEAIEEIEFILDLMDKSGIDEIFKQYRRDNDLKGFKTCQDENIPTITLKGDVL